MTIWRLMAFFLNYAKENPNTLLILTGDHETGGLCVNGSVEKKNVHFVFTSQHHTGIGVPVYAIGPGASEFTGFYENTDIFHRITGFFE